MINVSHGGLLKATKQQNESKHMPCLCSAVAELTLIWEQKERAGVYRGTGRRAERFIHLFAADSVVSASPLPAYLLPGKLFVVVSFNPDTNHTWFVDHFLDDFAIFADDFACEEKKNPIEQIQAAQ